MWRADIEVPNPRRCELLGRSACYPRSTFYPLSDVLPCGTTGSLCSTFVPDRPGVSQSSALMPLHSARTVTNRAEGPLEASVTLWRRPPQSNYPPSTVPAFGLGLKQAKGGISTLAPQRLAHLLQSLPPILHIACPESILSYSKGSRGLFVPFAGNRHLHRYYNFTELMVETVSRSLHHSCRSELTRQGISLP